MPMLLLQCPKCKNKMKYMTQSSVLTGKRKRCVYCGRSYAVRKQMVKLVK